MKVHYSDEYMAREAYAVFIRKERPSRSVTRDQLIVALSEPSVYQDFLKVCLEHDGRASLEIPAGFKQGVYHVLQAIGLSRVQREMGLSRVTLYRMFAPSGNPSLSTFMRVLRYLC